MSTSFITEQTLYERMVNQESVDLTKLYTKQLLNLLRRSYWHVEWHVDWSDTIIPLRENLKTELAKRPHVMNKAESKAARIARKKKGR